MMNFNTGTLISDQPGS